MIKTTMVFSMHAIHEFLRNIIIVSVLVLLALFIWLKIGIRAESFEIGPYKVSGLYIKLDKKLSLTAHDVIIPIDKAEPSLLNVDETFERLRAMLSYFDYIALHDIVYDNNRIDFIFADNLLHINTEDYEIAGRIGRKGKTMQAEVPLLYIKKEKISLNGKVAYNFEEDRLHTWGRYDMLGIKGNFSVSKIENKIAFDLQSDTFADLGPVVAKLPLRESITQWPGRRVLAKRYKLVSLRGGGTIEGKSFKFDFDALQGQLDLEDVTINFKDGVDNVNASKVVIDYRKGGLYFAMHDPFYLGRDLNGSSLSIVDLTGGKPTSMKLDLHVNAPMDDEMGKILKAYRLNIPVLQKNGSAKTHVVLDIVLKNGAVDAVVDTELQNADVRLYKVDLGVEKGKLHYENGKVTLHDIILKDTAYRAKVEGSIGLKEQVAKLKADVEHLTIGEDKKDFFVMKDKTMDIAIDYRDVIEISIPGLALTIKDTQKQTKVNLDDLTLIKPYLKNPAAIQDGGTAAITTEDFKHMSFEGILRRNSCFFYEGNNTCSTRVAYEGKSGPEGIDFYAFGKRFHYQEGASRITLENLNIDLERFMDYEKTLHPAEPEAAKEQKTLVILGKQSNLRYKEYTLVTDSYDIEIKPDGNINAMGSTQGDIIRFEKKGNNISLDALRIRDKALHPLINFDGLSQGRYSVKLSGDPNKVMTGKIIIEGGVMKNFKAYNNTLALLNTLPALATLQDPGFSAQGYRIKKGIANYRVIESKKIIFDSIYIQGGTSTIAGTGEVDIEKGTIDIKLAIQTARKLGEVVGSIPLLGYILFGDEKSVTIGLTITGALEKPNVQTSAAKDVLSLPIQMLKRTLESPSQMMDKKKKAVQRPADKTGDGDTEVPSDPLDALETL